VRDVQSVNWRGPRNPSEPIIYVVRHGDTELNKEHKFRGFMNVNLDSNGIRQAYDARDALDRVEFKHAYSSDLNRAAVTLNIILHERPFVAYQRLAAMRPWHIGKFAGTPKTEKAKQALQVYADHPSAPIPDGESLDWFRSRYQHFFEQAVKEAVESGPTLLAQHASNNHEVGNIIYGDIDAVDVDPGGIIGVYFIPGSGLEARVLKGKNHSKQMSYS
jgi:broad specificity phosphatase PhoE